mgnify:CR=1 FL=1
MLGLRDGSQQCGRSARGACGALAHSLHASADYIEKMHKYNKQRNLRKKGNAPLRQKNYPLLMTSKVTFNDKISGDKCRR